jgi:hypothetical protein
MSVDKPQTISSDEAITLGNELIVDDIAKGLIAKQSLDIPFEAPILGAKIIDIVDKCESDTISEPLVDQIKGEMSKDEPTLEMVPVQTKDESEENVDKETKSKEDHFQVDKEKTEEEIKDVEPVVCESQTAPTAKDTSSNETKICEGKNNFTL